MTALWRRNPEPEDAREAGTSPATVEDAWPEQGFALIYKHSTRCGVSLDAIGQVERFAQRHPDVAILVVDVLRQRDLSNRIARNLGVRHHSPQAILLKDGEAVWSATHFKITADAISAAIA